MKYAFIRAHRGEFGVRAMCRVLRVHFSGFYAWLKEPLSHRAQEDARQTELIRQAWSDSGKVYGYRKLTDDLRDQGERISENRVARLASLAGIAAQIGYRRRPGRYGITYIKTHEGWLYLCVVIDLFSRRVVGWSAQSRNTPPAPGTRISGTEASSPPSPRAFVLRRRTYPTRDAARQDVFEYIELFYNPMLSPVENENPQTMNFFTMSISHDPACAQ
jgi:putative transposase